MQIHELSPADLSDARALHTANWRSEYAEDLSPQALGATVEKRMADYWARVPEGHMALAARGAAGDFLGFIRIDPGHEKGPYVDSLHVAAAARGQGVGAALMARAAGLLAAQGHGTMWLEVMDRNHRGRAFYRRLGGVETEAFEEIMLGETVRARAIHWNRLDGLAVD